MPITREDFEAQARLDMRNKTGLLEDEVNAGVAGQSMKDYYSDWYDSLDTHVMSKDEWISNQMKQNAWDHHVDEKVYGRVADDLVKKGFGKEKYGCQSLTTDEEYQAALESGEQAQVNGNMTNMTEVYEKISGTKSPTLAVANLVLSEMGKTLDNIFDANKKIMDEAEIGQGMQQQTTKQAESDFEMA